MEQSNGFTEKIYLLTGGLVPLLENRHNLDLTAEGRRELMGLEGSYFNEFKNRLNGHNDEEKGLIWDVKSFSGKKIENEFGKMLSLRSKDRPLISFDDIYCTGLADGFYHVTRLMDPNNLSSGTFLGPRFNYPSLDEQIREIKVKFGGEIDIMDIGTFEGETIDGEVKMRFAKQGVNIKNAFLYVAGIEGIRNLRVTGLKVEYVHSFDWIDWIELRDCFGLDGRKISVSTEEGVVNSFVPYTHDSNSWASIPNKFREDFDSMYMDYFVRIKEILSQMRININLEKSKKDPVSLDLMIAS
jgi:hypothetical protein